MKSYQFSEKNLLTKSESPKGEYTIRRNISPPLNPQELESHNMQKFNAMDIKVEKNLVAELNN